MDERPIQRAMQCRQPGCESWALLATPDQIADDAAYLWRCDNGHHGPRVVGVTGAGSVEWSDE